MPRVCPIHSFRDLGSLEQVFWFFPLISGDRQFCPCPPDRWRSFVLRKGPSTIEDKMMAVHVMFLEAFLNTSDQSDSHGYCLRTEVLKAKYWKARQQWIEKTGRQLRSRAELEKESFRRIVKFISEGNKIHSLRTSARSPTGGSRIMNHRVSCGDCGPTGTTNLRASCMEGGTRPR